MLQVRKHFGYRLLVTLSVGLGVWMSSKAQSLTWLGVTSDYRESKAYGVSADGNVVVGSAVSVYSETHPFRWQRGSGMSRIGSGAGVALGVSANGVVVVGQMGVTAFRHSSATGTQSLGVLYSGDSESAATGVSANGAVIVGWSRRGSLPNIERIRAFRWTSATGMVDLGTLPGGNFSEAHGVSGDGFVVVGAATNAQRQWRAFRWTQPSGMQEIGVLPGGNASIARAASGDGSVIVGKSTIANGQWRAFRWTAQTGIVDLGVLPGGTESEALSVSASGTVIVGWSRNFIGDPRAVRWTPQRGLEDLNVAFASLLQDGSELYYANAVSADGRYIVGWGFRASIGRYEAFLLDTGETGCAPPHPADVNGDGAINNADLLEVLFNFGWRRCP